MKKYLLLFSVIAILLQSCVTSRGLYKKGYKMEQAGQYEIASDFYYQSIIRDKQNIVALQGMKRVGTKIVSGYLSEFTKNKLSNNYKQAVYIFLKAKAYQKKIEQVHVALEIPSFYQEDFLKVKNQHLEQEYKKGIDCINNEDFKKAEQCFNEIYRFDKDYKDVASLRNIAYLEPLYRKAEANKKQQKYRQSYFYYQKILNRTTSYKKAKQHLQYILEKGAVPIAIIGRNSKIYQRHTESIKQFVTNTMIKKQDPFIKIVDRENIDKIVQEQELTMSGIVSDKSQVEVGELSSIKYTIVVNVTSYNIDYKAPKAKALKGFEKYSVKTTKDGETHYQTKYKPVTYYLYEGHRKVSMTASYKIISVKTGEILATDIIQRSNLSEVEYASYNGNRKKLYGFIDGKPATSYKEHEVIKNWLNASRTLQEKASLTNALYNKIGNDIADKIFNVLYIK